MRSLVSTEFTALCQGQLSLLAQGVGASLSVVYLAEEWLGGQATTWVPIAIYPEAAMDGPQGRPLQLPSSIQLQAGVSLEETGTFRALQPLYFNGHPIGLLVIAREGKRWQQEDYGQLEQVGYTLSAACALERRVQWLQTRFRQQEMIQEQQQDLLDNLIHQFRNPLTALRTFGKLLLRRMTPEDNNRQVAEGIVRESDRLQDLLKQMNATVDDYGALPPASPSSSLAVQPLAANPLAATPPATNSLEAEHLEAESLDPDAWADEAEVFEGDWEDNRGLTSALPPASPLTGRPLEISSCQILDILQPLLSSFRAIAEEKGQAVEFHLPQQPVRRVKADPESLREVVSNLLDNALKYGNPAGTVVVSIEQDEATLTLGVSDDGPGIPLADQPRLFERHYRGVQASGPKPGSGLGLAIARTLVEQMGGQLTLESPAGRWHPSITPTAPGSAFLTSLRNSPLDSL